VEEAAEQPTLNLRIDTSTELHGEVQQCETFHKKLIARDIPLWLGDIMKQENMML